VKAFRHRSFDAFKQHYETLDLLLIDDIQFISGNKSATQEQFFYTFNSMIEHKKQIVITCDTNPREIDGIEERLKSRFAWGLTVSIEPPELEMRAAILIRKAQMERVGLSDEVALFIARQIRSNVRELEGALKRLLAFANFHKQPVSLNLAKEALKDLLPGRAISLDHIQKEVADYYRIKVVDMYSARRNRAIARPRQLAMKLARELTELSLPDIGESFGGRDHTTVMHACKTIETLCGEDPAIKRDYETLLALLSA
jgi:chromosomal replication initiator protein